MSKRFLIVCRQPPYGSSFAREALDISEAVELYKELMLYGN